MRWEECLGLYMCLMLLFFLRLDRVEKMVYLPHGPCKCKGKGKQHSG